MKKIMIVSDTHGDVSGFQEAVEREGKLDMVIHCGDVGVEEDRIARIAGCEAYIARGNCDTYSSIPEEVEVRIGRIKALVVHGHKYFVDFTLDRLCYAAKEKEVDIVFYGHTHKPVCMTEYGLWFVNPGSISRPRTSPPKWTYAIMTVEDDGEYNIEIREL